MRATVGDEVDAINTNLSPTYLTIKYISNVTLIFLLQHMIISYFLFPLRKSFKNTTHYADSFFNRVLSYGSLTHSLYRIHLQLV